MGSDKMDLIVGIAMLAASLAVLVFLVLWGRRTIERISRRGSRSAREISRDLHSDR